MLAAFLFVLYCVLTMFILLSSIGLIMHGKDLIPVYGIITILIWIGGSYLIFFRQKG